MSLISLSLSCSQFYAVSQRSNSKRKHRKIVHRRHQVQPPHQPPITIHITVRATIPLTTATANKPMELKRMEITAIIIATIATMVNGIMVNGNNGDGRHANTNTIHNFKMNSMSLRCK